LRLAQKPPDPLDGGMQTLFAPFSAFVLSLSLLSVAASSARADDVTPRPVLGEIIRLSTLWCRLERK
jgi:hypothetical protein